ncbi:MAG TPA: hypothetical protein PLP33_07130 [Leptospiraceae bacterium]|jgi:hypothetical protein|nr:hypothetical protein [Leptospiraceae bacterium]
MARLFITEKEMQYHADITQEVIKDVIGQKVYYYSISTTKSLINETYDEAIEKVFDGPIIVDALCGQPEWENITDSHGSYLRGKMEVLFQAKDLLLKKIKISEGDFITYGNHSYEIVSYAPMNNMWGQEEFDRSFKATCMTARPGKFDPSSFNTPSSEGMQGGIQKEFVQQRGLEQTKEGLTNDTREMRERLGDDMAPKTLGDGPRVIGTNDPNPENSRDEGIVNSFLNDNNVDDDFYD